MMILKKFSQYISLFYFISVISLLAACTGNTDTSLPESEALDKEGPVVKLTSPANGDNEILTNAVFTITFDEQVAFNTGMIEIRPYSNAGILDQLNLLSFDSANPFDIVKNELFIYLKQDELQPATRYRVRLHDVKDILGNPIVASCEWEFATVADTPITIEVLDSNPCIGQKQGEGNLAKLELSGGTSLDQTFHIGTSNYTATVNFLTTNIYVIATPEYSSAKVLINNRVQPAINNADPNAVNGVSIALTNGINNITISVTDTNNIKKIYILAITRQENSITKPVILSVTPANLNTNVPIAGVISVKFNLPMNTTSLQNNITLSQEFLYSNNVVQLQALTSDSTNTVILTPTTPLIPGTIYQITIKGGPSGVLSTGSTNNSLGKDITSIFTTENSANLDEGGAGQWTWVGGYKEGQAANKYGSPTLPGYRYGHSINKDSNGKIWMFGGNTTLTTIPNDVWKLDSFVVPWVWTKVRGDTTTVLPNYGTQGTAASTNDPSGNRFNHSSWMDLQNNLWVFGGNTRPASAFNYRNDLWKFNTTTLQWTWIKGNKVANQPSVCGSMGSAASGNTPGARQGAASWTTTIPAKPAIPATLTTPLIPAVPAYNQFWLFGGLVATPGIVPVVQDWNDLWMFSNLTSQWICISPNQTEQYGTIRVPSGNNIPPARSGASTWTDTNGNFWLFGGTSTNDLWKYDVINSTWTWMSGPVVGDKGVYGTKGNFTSTNYPGTRGYAMSWTDHLGNFWLAGGSYYHLPADKYRYYSDLWKFNGTNWAWIRGSKFMDLPGNFGTFNTPLAANTPNSRNASATWSDEFGNLFMMGGVGTKALPSGSNIFDDIWIYATP